MEKTKEFPLSSVFWFAIIAFLLTAVLSAIIGPNLAKFYPLPEDAGPEWYYWQQGEYDTITQISYWLAYAIHQIVVWLMFIVYRKQKVKKGFANQSHVLMLLVNFLFVILHLVQTHIWYDGLAKDVPIWTSQGSVIIMLILILVLMMPRRGLFFGKFKTVPPGLYSAVQKSHGFIISWALVYTFWFHPMEGNWGLLSGFIYMYLLFMQMSLSKTSLHTNKSWIVLLEAFVIVHSTLITLYKEKDFWPLFFFGFMWMFMITQLYTWKLKTWIYSVIWILYIGSIALVYAFFRSINHIQEIVFIPIALYGGALALIGIGYLGEFIRRGSGKQATT